MSEINLKPCPFCKGKVGVFEYCKKKSKMFFEIECGFCHLIMRSRFFEIDDDNERKSALKWLVSDWNRRADNDPKRP